MSPPPTPGYGQPFTPGHGASAGGANRPATLGIIGLALVGIQLLVVIALALGPSVMVVTYSSTSDSMGQPDVSRLSAGDLLIPLAIAFVGLAGWIIGIVATVTNRGRAFGIAAIVVGTLTGAIAAPMMFGALLLKSVG